MRFEMGTPHPPTRLSSAAVDDSRLRICRTGKGDFSPTKSENDLSSSNGLPPGIAVNLALQCEGRGDAHLFFQPDTSRPQCRRSFRGVCCRVGYRSNVKGM